MNIRRFTSGDLPALIQIQKDVLPGGGWSESDYLRLARSGGLVLAAETCGPPAIVVGYAVAAHTGADAEILGLAVAANYQRQGIGRQLLNRICGEMAQLGICHTYLEVRASNRPAISLYTISGFTMRYIRHRYYTEPAEDAYVMSQEIIPPLPPYCA